MTEVLDAILAVLQKYSLATALAMVGAVMGVSYWLSRWLSAGRVHGSAIAILFGLLLAYVGGVFTGGSRGIADITCLAGMGVLGGAGLRDIAIVATAFGVSLEEFLKTGLAGVVALLSGVLLSFVIGAAVAYAFGYRDAVSMTTLGAGAATYIVGPVTGAALGASSELIALSVATGLCKSVLVMIATPVVAPWIGLNNPRSALIFGGLMGTTSGVAGGLAATDERLVPFGAMSATFYTGLGCLLGPSAMYAVISHLVSS